jgi:uncharacterized protein
MRGSGTATALALWIDVRCVAGPDRAPRTRLTRTNEGDEKMQRSPAAVEVRKNETTRLYEALIDGQVVGNLAYETTGGRVSLTHSFVDEDRRHRGIASALARYALEDLSQSDSRVGIFCGFVADYVHEHPEFHDAVDINRSAFLATRTARDTARGR